MTDSMTPTAARELIAELRMRIDAVAPGFTATAEMWQLLNLVCNRGDTLLTLASAGVEAGERVAAIESDLNCEKYARGEADNRATAMRERADLLRDHYECKMNGSERATRLEMWATEAELARVAAESECARLRAELEEARKMPDSVRRLRDLMLVASGNHYTIGDEEVESALSAIDRHYAPAAPSGKEG